MVAVPAKNLKASREMVQFQPVIQPAATFTFAAAAEFSSMPRPVIGDVVNRQKHLFGQLAAYASATICRQHSATTLSTECAGSFRRWPSHFCRAAQSAANIKFAADLIPAERLQRLDAFAFRASPLTARHGQLLTSSTRTDLIPTAPRRHFRIDARQTGPGLSPIVPELTNRLACRTRPAPSHSGRQRNRRKLWRDAAQSAPLFLPVSVTGLAIGTNPPGTEQAERLKFAAFRAPAHPYWPFWSSAPHQWNLASTQPHLLCHAIMLIHAHSIVKAHNDG